MAGTRLWLIGMVSVFPPCPSYMSMVYFTPLQSLPALAKWLETLVFLNPDAHSSTQGAVPMMSSPVTSSSACYLTQCVMVLPIVLMAVTRTTAVPSSQVWAPPASGWVLSSGI